MGSYRLVRMNDPQDGTGKIRVSADPLVEIPLDKTRVLPPVELNDEQAAVIRRYGVLEEVSSEDAAAALVNAAASGEQVTYTKEQLNGLNVEQLTTIAEQVGIDAMPERKPDIIKAILAAQEGVSV